jgi:hypothetical protein
LVIAVDARIKNSEGKHSFNLAAFLPVAAITFFGFIDTVRTAILEPVIVYFATCYLRGYHFRKRHYLALGAAAFAFFSFLGPLEVFTRYFTEDQTLQQRIYISFHILATHHDPQELRRAIESDVETGGGREQYYDHPGTSLLSRFSLIRMDSNVISTCASGFHYGLVPAQIETINIIPSFFFKSKPRYTSGNDYIGRVSGMSGDSDHVTYPAITAVGDSYGAFGWLGVIIFSLTCFPLAFIVFESMFDISSTWGTLVLGICFVEFGEITMGRFFPALVRIPLTLVLLSYVMGAVVKMFPVKMPPILPGFCEQPAKGA